MVSDIQGHMATLRHLAAGLTTCVEFGTRTGRSTVALLAGLANYGGTLHSYDLNDCTPAVPASVVLGYAVWNFTQADTTTLPDIPECDLLFIDTLHDARVVTAELAHAHRVARWIILHDVVLFGSRDETTGHPPGIMAPILHFLAAHTGEWKVAEFYEHDCGLLVLGRVFV